MTRTRGFELLSHTHAEQQQAIVADELTTQTIHMLGMSAMGGGSGGEGGGEQNQTDEGFDFGSHLRTLMNERINNTSRV